jgi:putative transposase
MGSNRRSGGLWRRSWQGIVPFFPYLSEVPKIVYTTNAIENLNMGLRKAIKMRGYFQPKSTGSR